MQSIKRTHLMEITRLVLKTENGLDLLTSEVVTCEVVDQDDLPAIPSITQKARAIVTMNAPGMQYNKHNVGFFDIKSFMLILHSTILKYQSRLTSAELHAVVDYYNQLLPVNYYQTHVWHENGKTFEYGISTDLAHDLQA